MPEPFCAWGVKQLDRWRPYYVLLSPIDISGANWCGLHIELVSLAGHPTLPRPDPPYTPEQYGALRELLAEIYARRGRLPIIGHGMVQRDRSDPVAFDWAAVGPWDGRREGYFWAMCEQEHARIAELEADQLWANDLKQRFEALLRDTEGKRSWRRPLVPPGSVDQLIAETNADHGRE